MDTEQSKVKRELATLSVDSCPVVEDRNMLYVVDGAHAFILRISSYVGLAPLRFEPRSNGYTVTISKGMCIYSYGFITVLMILAVFGLVAEIYVGVELSVKMTSRMSQFVCSCDVLVVVVTAGAGVYGAPKRIKNMLKYMESVATVDTSIGVHYSMSTERKLCGIMLAVLSCFFMLNVGDFCFYVVQAQKINRQWYIVINNIGFYLLWFVLVVLELQFAFTAFSVHARFRAVNDALAHTAMQLSLPGKRCVESPPLNIFAIRVAQSHGYGNNVSLLIDSESGDEHVVIIRRATGEPKLLLPPYVAIRRLANLHSSLYTVVQGVCECYGLPLIVILISTLLHMIETPYLLLMEIILGTHRIYFIALLFLWCIIHVVRVFLVVEPCHYTIGEGKRTEQLVCRMLNSTASTGKLITRLELFSRQLMLQSVSYTPMGMCTLDRPLIATILGTVTTYLVILIQFQNTEE